MFTKLFFVNTSYFPALHFKILKKINFYFQFHQFVFYYSSTCKALAYGSLKSVSRSCGLTFSISKSISFLLTLLHQQLSRYISKRI